NCCYRIADLGSFKLVELRMMFACSNEISGGNDGDQTILIKLPNSIQPDENIESWFPTNRENVYIHVQNKNIGVFTQNGAKLPANCLLSFHMLYFMI
ncbi:MAG: hypothetical protein NC489_46135, partial [Ruminococcus flavefaciens]|nr:hypothetical protein [Ruminococcus flavefaciens]